MRHPFALPALILALLTTLLLGGCDDPAHPTVDLSRAVRVGDLDQIKRHVYWKTDLNQADRDGNHPLHVAARAGQVGIARELVQHGASLVAVDGAGRTPLELALINGRTQVAVMLVKEGATVNAQAILLALVRAGVADRDSFAFLLRRGADLNRPDAHGAAPLHLAVGLGHLETVKRLIARGADINQPDGSGRTPLALALGLDPKGTNTAAIRQALQQSGARP